MTDMTDEPDGAVDAESVDDDQFPTPRPAAQPARCWTGTPSSFPVRPCPTGHPPTPSRPAWQRDPIREEPQ